MYRTLAKPVAFEGIGLHSGNETTISICPAEPRDGIRFMRVDLPCSDSMSDSVIEARYDLVSDTHLSTQLTNANGVSVSTVEHLMAALAGSGISDALIRIDGCEVPILDGSSQQYIQKFRETGLNSTPEPRRAIRITRPITVESNGRRAELLPAPVPTVVVQICFDDEAIGTQDYEFELTNGHFATDLADCRTFCLLSDVKALHNVGLARGGSLDNAIVVDNGRVLNPEGLRRPDEFVRHKILDAIGDLALAGAPIIGCYKGELTGHEMTNRLLHALFESPDSWEWCEAQGEVLPSLDDFDPIAANMPTAMAV